LCSEYGRKNICSFQIKNKTKQTNKMGRHHDLKYGRSVAAPAIGRYGMRTGGLGSLVPLIGLGAVVAVLFALFNRKRTWFRLKGLGMKRGLGWRRCFGWGAATTGIAATAAVQQQNCATVGFNEKLIAAERLPGVKYREVDVITRKRVRNLCNITTNPFLDPSSRSQRNL
jgi:hypothetical protein